VKPVGAVHLGNGRTLTYAECGDPDEWPVIECHGNPGCRVLLWDEGVAARLGVRLITVDRPGIGLSSPDPGRSVADWAGDVGELCDAIGFERFSLLGHSVGGAYACACAERLGQRVASMALVSSIAPLDRPGAFAELGRPLQWSLARDHPAIARGVFAAQALLGRLPLWALRRPAGARLPVADRAVLEDDPRVVERGAAMVSEAVRQGPDGLVEDLRVAMRPWGVDLSAISVPTTVWQGDQDRSIPPAWGELLARSIPGARLRLCPGAGHLMIVANLAPILEDLLDRGGVRTQVGSMANPARRPRGAPSVG
jgi:pimeloyl-ACP methyl ester carboxylesterase